MGTCESPPDVDHTVLELSALSPPHTSSQETARTRLNHLSDLLLHRPPPTLQDSNASLSSPGQNCQWRRRE